MAAYSNLEIPDSVASQITSIIGPFQVICNYRAQGSRTGVWKVAASTQSFILKLYHEKRKWHPEVYAYTHWTKAYAPYAPELVGVIENEEIHGILTTVIPGFPLREMQFPDNKIAEVFFQAGQLARSLHSCQPGEWFGIPDYQGFPLHDSTHDPVSTMKADFEKWYTKAINLQCLEKTEIALGEWALENMNVYAGELPLPINQDYSPGNWLVNEQGKLVGVVDFECMAWGVRVDSFALLWDRYFPENPRFEEAFWNGYGIDLGEILPLQVFNVCIKIGIADISLGTEFKNELSILSGRQLIRRVADDLYPYSVRL
ncbi:MAG: aminoglycoside phosphotransferase family protein [Anaerolineaceae bacterium]|jgi:Ser/Thr protein kinase RdoA (MazF antagonist)